MFEKCAEKMILNGRSRNDLFFICPAGIEHIRRWQRVRVHVQRAHGVAATGPRVQVQDQRPTQVGVKLAEKQNGEL